MLTALILEKPTRIVTIVSQKHLLIFTSFADMI